MHMQHTFKVLWLLLFRGSYCNYSSLICAKTRQVFVKISITLLVS